MKNKNLSTNGYILVCITVLVMFLLLTGCRRKVTDFQEKESTITKQKIIEIANKKAIAEGILLEKSEVYYDVDNKEWEKTLISLRKDYPNDARRLKILGGFDYQTVLYKPKSPTAMGGVLWVFIDRKSGQVITLFAEI